MIVSNPSNSVSHAEMAPDSLAKRPLLWLNLVCLDAPLVAVVWQCFFARAFEVRVRPQEAAALFFTAWGIYLFDRLLDSLRLRDGGEQSVRAQFCRRHQIAATVILVMVGLVDAFIILTSLERELIIPGAMLGLVTQLYLGVNHLFSRVWHTLPLKEIATGFLFAAGTVLVSAVRASLSPAFVVAALLLGLICSLNCLGIAVWERSLDQDQGKHSFATNGRKAERWVKGLTILAIVGAVAFAAMAHVRSSLGWALFLSAVLLLLLQVTTVRRDERTALADLVLLTPLLFLLL
jgi:hypothetical protein